MSKCQEKIFTSHKPKSLIRNRLISLGLTSSQVASVLHLHQDVIQEIKRKEILINDLERDNLEINQSLQYTIQELATSNAQKQQYIESNMQLENFAHIASHDLKAPLTNIMSLTMLMMRKSNAKLDSAEKELLKNISLSAKSMRSTIKGLFEFSQASNTKLTKKIFSLDKMLKQVLLNIDTQIKSCHARIEITNPDNYIYADPVLIQEVFQNIILNATKFIKHNQEVVITIKAEEHPEYWQCSVGDNGIGISEEYQDNIFVIFKRLYTREEYEGTGIGLAICKKIIDLHEGEIWVDSKKGKGSTFFIKIPKEK